MKRLNAARPQVHRALWSEYKILCEILGVKPNVLLTRALCLIVDKLKDNPALMSEFTFYKEEREDAMNCLDYVNYLTDAEREELDEALVDLNAVFRLQTR